MTGARPVSKRLAGEINQHYLRNANISLDDKHYMLTTNQQYMVPHAAPTFTRPQPQQFHT